jgi:RimJ/RimL family protein N-acetyltransferase
MQVAPVLETERLRLRSHQSSDFADCVSMWSDPGVVRYTIRDPSPPPRTWLRILAYRGHWALLGFGYWAIEDRVSGRFVGELGFADFKRDIQPSIDARSAASLANFGTDLRRLLINCSLPPVHISGRNHSNALTGISQRK